MRTGDTLTFALVLKNKTTKRFEAVGEAFKNSTEMVVPVDLEDQLKNVELQVETLLHFQEANQTEHMLDPEMASALIESINFVSSKGASYFDKKRIEDYFGSAKERKRANKDDLPELGGFIDKPIIKTKSKHQKDKESEIFFYQDLSGSNIYLHYLCQEFIEQYVGLEHAPEYIKVS